MQALYIPEGRYQESYTPAATRVTSTVLGGKQLRYVKFMIESDGAVTWKDLSGNEITRDLKGGIPYPFLVSVISASASDVTIIHDGALYNLLA